MASSEVGVGVVRTRSPETPVPASLSALLPSSPRASASSPVVRRPEEGLGLDASVRELAHDRVVALYGALVAREAQIVVEELVGAETRTDDRVDPTTVAGVSRVNVIYHLMTRRDKRVLMVRLGLLRVASLGPVASGGLMTGGGRGGGGGGGARGSGTRDFSEV